MVSIVTAIKIVWPIIYNVGSNYWKTIVMLDFIDFIVYFVDLSDLFYGSIFKN